MTPDIELFLKSRVQRFREVSQDLENMGYPSKIVEICDGIEHFLAGRPAHPFFKQALGTRFVRLDMKWLFPATLGIDLRQYFTGPNLLFDPSRLLKEKQIWDKNIQQSLQSLAKWYFLFSTYNLHAIPLENEVLTDSFFDPYKEKLQEQKEFLNKYLHAKLQKILDDPLQARTLKLDKGKLEWRVNNTVSDTLLKGILEQVKKGTLTISCSLLENVFEQLCRGTLVRLQGSSLLVDPKQNIELNLIRMRKHPIQEPEFLKILQCRYDHATYLLAYLQYAKQLKKKEELKKQLNQSLNLSGLSFDPQIIQSFLSFVSEDPGYFEENGFLFNPLSPEDGISWPREERRSVYLGALPEKQVSPEHLPLPDSIQEMQTRPVVIMLDISGSMYSCMENAILAVKELFLQLEGHPVSLVLFATWAGLLNKGTPWVSQKQAMDADLPWLEELLKQLQSDSLGGDTSIGNGVMLAKALAVSIANKMKSRKKWKEQNGVIAHCILVSDNLHNTPRDVSAMDDKGSYLLNHKENLVSHAVKKGCVVHNVICGACQPPDPENPIKPTKASLVYRLFQIQQKLAFNEGFFGVSEDSDSASRNIRKQIYLVDVVKGSVLFKRTIVQQGIDKKLLFEMRHDPATKTHSLTDFACLICYVRQYVTPNASLLGMLQGLLQRFQLKVEDFWKDSIDVTRLQDFWNYLLETETVDFTQYDLSLIDGDLLGIFRISRLITETQKVIKNHSNYAVVLNENEPVATTVGRVVEQIGLYEQETLPPDPEEAEI
ncbi:MAG: VWA domain-containing protein [SAR324 cluster bacterium]|nr:VWA domain-containing protein [SAR324 cluster bacterium]